MRPEAMSGNEKGCLRKWAEDGLRSGWEPGEDDASYERGVVEIPARHKSPQLRVASSSYHSLQFHRTAEQCSLWPNVYWGNDGHLQGPGMQVQGQKVEPD